MILNGFNIKIDSMSFEDLVIILNTMNGSTVQEFVKNVPAYLKPEDFFNFLSFVIENDKNLIDKFKINKELTLSINILENKVLNK